MQKQIILILVSDQTVQNVQFIREFYNIKDYIFLTTPKMDKKGCSQWIINASGISKSKVKEVQVDEFSITTIKRTLQKIIDSDTEYYVNITGGTKIMSIATKEFFQKHEHAKIFYLTGIKSTFLELDSQSETKRQLNYQVPLLEYLASYGVHLKDSNANVHYLYEDENTTQKIYDAYLRQDNIHEFYKNLKPQANIQDDSKCKKYLSSKWFEEYTYNLIKKELSLGNDFIGMGLVLQKEGITKTDNDFDIMFMWQNQLYIVECKTSYKPKGKPHLTKFVYKLDSLIREFGIFSKASIFTLLELPNIRDDRKKYQDRLKFHRMTLLSPQEQVIENQKSIKNWLKELKKN